MQETRRLSIVQTPRFVSDGLLFYAFAAGGVVLPFMGGGFVDEFFCFADRKREVSRHNPVIMISQKRKRRGEKL